GNARDDPDRGAGGGAPAEPRPALPAQSAGVSLHPALAHRPARLHPRPVHRLALPLLHRLARPRRAELGGPGQLPAYPHGRSAVPAHAEEHGLLRRLPCRRRQRRGPRPGAIAQPEVAGLRPLPHPLLSAHGHERGGDRAGLLADVQRQHRPHQRRPPALRHHRAELALQRDVDDARADRDQHLGCRRADADLPSRPAERPGRAHRGGDDRRGGPLAALPERAPPADLTGDLLQRDGQRHRLVQGLHPGQGHHRGRPGQRDPLLRPLSLPPGLREPADGLRDGAGLDPLPDHLRPVRAADLRVPPLGLLRIGGQGM
ncbi:MAG: N-acetyl-D-glucosamine ABC transporter, permease protein 1, partial [uncultured Thermomicrobiales bacterium]